MTACYESFGIWIEQSYFSRRCAIKWSKQHFSIHEKKKAAIWGSTLASAIPLIFDTNSTGPTSITCCGGGASLELVLGDVVMSQKLGFGQAAATLWRRFAGQY
jgi:hypothetical protein